MSEIINGFVSPVGANREMFNRAKAKENSDKYYIGSNCKNNHGGLRLVKDGQCVECRSLLRKKYNNKNRARARKWELKKNFNITEEDYNVLLIKQNYVCAICNKPENTKYKSGKIRMLAVDHCHDTNKIRGLLCYKCNVGIGFLNHSPELLRQAALYCEEI